VADAIRKLVEPLQTGAWTPTIARRGGRVLDYAPYRLIQFEDADLEAYPSMSEAVIAAAQREVSSVVYERLKRPLLEALAARLDQARRKRSSLERSLAAADSADELRESGEAILGSTHAIEAGATSLTWDGRRIDLYPTLSPVENAQAYFKRYADARDAKTSVPPLLEQVAGELEHLEEMAVHVETADSEKAINALKRELEDASIIRIPSGQKRGDQRSRKSASASGIHTRLVANGAEILVGGSATGNEWITFHLAKPDDLWFHARGVPGAHVILRGRSGEPSPDQVEAAAAAAAGRSAARDAGKVDVDYTLRKYVRKIRGGAPGRVSYRHERTIAVAPQKKMGVESDSTPITVADPLDAARQLLPELRLRHVADDPVDFLTVLEQDHRRNPGDVEAPREGRVGVDIDLRDL
jgi:predicted ribosome quality control (RQC) complex YloA/Tae2 family protein